MSTTKHTLRAIFAAAALLLLLDKACFAEEPKLPFTISAETTRVTSPLTKIGLVDYFAALEKRYYPPEFATDDNGFRIFIRQFGNVAETTKDDEFYRLQKYGKLGLDSTVPPTLQYPLEPWKIVEEFYKAKGEKVPEKLLLRGEVLGNLLRPWTLKEFPMLADWVNEMDKPLDAIAEAVRKPVFFIPFLQSPDSMESGKPQNLIAVLLPDLYQVRTTARLFAARASYRIAQGSIDGAIEDKLTIHRLGRQVSASGPLVQYLVGIAIEGMAATIQVGANPKHPLTKEQAQRLLAGLDALPPRTSLEHAYEWERFMALDAAQSFATGEDTFFDIKLPTQMLRFAVDWDVTFRQVNEAYDALQEPPPREKWHKMVKAFEEKKQWVATFPLMSANNRGVLVADMLIAILMPALDAVETATYRSECSDNLQRLTLAMLMYQNEHGKLPDKDWAAQIEKYLGKNPEQYFSCPSKPSPKGETVYAMVHYGDLREPATVSPTGDIVPGSRDTILLIELAEPVPLNRAVVPVDTAMEECQRPGKRHHTAGMNVGYRSGVVRFMPQPVSEAELHRLLTP